jgi:peptide/nickel transport system permease protein
MAKSQAQAMTTAVPAGAISKAIASLLRDRIVAVAIGVLISLYVAIAFAGFFAPYGEGWSDRQRANAKYTPIYMVDANSGQVAWPYVFRYEKQFNADTFDYGYTPVMDQQYPIHFFVKGDPYKLFGFIPMDMHLFGVDAPARISLLGNDINGRDIFSRMFYGGQISLTIGFLSLLVVFPIGMVYGGIAGYFGGWVDNLMMRFAEIIMSIPTYFLLVSLAAILPPGLSSAERFTMVILILAFIGWAGLSRVIRGMVLSIKNQEFVEAARAVGVSPLQTIVKHILPQTASYVLVAITLNIPGYILAESGLSFLGLGIQQPDASWGNMLKEAQDIGNLMTRPEMMMPGFLIFLAVLAFNVIGDALRDILDPKSTLRR